MRYKKITSKILQKSRFFLRNIFSFRLQMQAEIRKKSENINYFAKK